ncbi:MAG TPA: DUF11 domain-containing protein [Armatimonadota bacterium]|nr:DUF11 domain-containing protein [Armatimonadota bacterium]
MGAVCRRIAGILAVGLLACGTLLAPGGAAGRARQAPAPLVLGEAAQGTLAYGDVLTYDLALPADGPLALRYRVTAAAAGALTLELRAAGAAPVTLGSVRNDLGEKVLYLPQVEAGAYQVVLAQDNAAMGAVTYTLSAHTALATAALEDAAVPAGGTTRVYPIPTAAAGPLYVLLKIPAAVETTAHLYRDAITGAPLAAARGAGSQLLYLPAAAANGTYYLVLSAAGTAAAAPCTIEVARAIPTIPLTGEGGSLAGSIRAAGDFALYRVTAAANKPLYLGLFKETGWASYVEVRQGGADGAILYQTDRAAAPAGAVPDPWIVVPPPVGGDYVIRVEMFAPGAAAPAPLPYTLHALQALPRLQETTPVTADLPGPHSVRWYALPTAPGQPLFAFADHNSEHTVQLSLYLNGLAGPLAGIAYGPKDQLLFLPDAAAGTYGLKVSDSTAPSVKLTGGSHLPALPAASFTDTIANASDIHWYEVTVPAGEELLLHLDKTTAFRTDTPLRFSSPLNAPAATGSTTGDVTEVLVGPLTAYLRLTGAAGAYTLRATKSFPALPLGQEVDAALAHAGDERWFEVTAPAGKPLFLVAEQEGGGSRPVEVYRGSATAPAATFGGVASDYLYLPAQPAATRYLLRKRAPDAGFVHDAGERLWANTALPALADGGTISGRIAGAAHRKFYQLALPAGRPLTLQCTVPLVLQEPGHVKRLEVGTRAAVAGLGSPAVVTVASPTAGDFTLSATADLSGAGSLYYSNAAIEAKVNLAKTTVSRVKYYPGENVYLSGDGDGAPSLLAPEGGDFAGGWTLADTAADATNLQMTWRHAGTAVTRTLLIRGTAAGAELRCEVDTPRPMIFGNALIVPALPNGTLSYAVPGDPVAPKSYVTSGVTALYPATLGAFARPGERWAAYWNSAGTEVYGVALGQDHELALSTDGAYTVARVLAPAGRSAFSVRMAPKPDIPYSALQTGALSPALLLAHAADAAQVPVGTPITGTLTARNAGTRAATGTTLTCTLPAAATIVADSADPGTYAPATHTITWALGTLAVGAARTVTYQYTLDTATPPESTVELAAAIRCSQLPIPKHAACAVTVKGPTLTGVTPAAPDNAGPVTLGLSGACFAEHATVTLARGTETVTASAVALRADRKYLSALVDLTGKSGAWDIRVTNPGGATALLPAAVTPTAGGASEFWCELTAPRALTLHERATATVQFGNRGRADVAGRLLCLYLPGAVYQVHSVTDETGAVLASAEQTGALDGPLAWWLPRVGPGETHTLTVIFTPLVTRGRAAGALFPQATLATSALSAAQVQSLLADAARAAFAVPTAKAGAVTTLAGQAVPPALARWAGAPARPAWDPAVALAAEMRAAGGLAPLLPATDAAAAGALLEKAVALLLAPGAYPRLQIRRQYAPSITATGPAHGKTGPLGLSGVGFILANQTMDYRITARNPATATAAAKEVRIRDTLDAALNWSTLMIGPLRVAGKTVTYTNAVWPLRGYADLRPEVNSIAEVTVTFDAATGELVWVITGRDPARATVTDVLPPGMAVEAAIFVRPKTTLVSGAIIRNRATAALDGGAATPTNEVLNTIDAGMPTSAVAALPAVQEETVFTVRWSGQDEANGSGLACYTVYVSDNGGPYQVWQERVTATAAAFTGTFGHTYRFYSVAEDAIGHVEAAPAEPDAVTRIGRQVTLGRGLRLVSVPLKPEEADPKALLGFAEQKWARYLPGTGYVTYGNDPLKVTWLSPAADVPGRAYWGYWADVKTLEPAGQEVSRAAPVRIALAAGWNTFGNPWTKPVTWDPALIGVIAGGETKTLAAAAAAGWIADYAWGWTPGTANPTTGQYWLVGAPEIAGAAHHLDGWQGYWIKTTRACALELPPPAPAQALARGRALPADGWQVRLVASTGTGEDGWNWFGVGSPAAVRRAQGIIQPPAPLEPTVELSFPGGRAMAISDEAGPWRFTVTTPTPGETVTLSWPDLTGVPAGLGLVLVDEATGARRYLRTSAAYRFTMPADGRAASFRIETAARGALRLLALSAAPAGRGVGVAVQYRLTAPATVRAEIRTPTGRLIRALPPTRAAEGALCWDGRAANGARLARGAVLITLIAEDAEGRTVRGVTSCAVP